MKFILILIAQFFIIGINVSVAETAVPAAGMFTVQIPCGTTDRMAASLKKNFNETVIHSGFTGTAIMKFYRNEKTGTFTVAVEKGDFMCYLTAGEKLIDEVSGTAL